MTVISKLPAGWHKAVAAREDQLGVPGDKEGHAEYYVIQRVIWTPWMQSVTEHRWRFVDEMPCLNCGQLETVMQAGEHKQTLCIECLSTVIPWWPTGWSMPMGRMYVKHSESCTSHSSYPTSSSSIPYETISSPSTTPSGPKPASKSTSSYSDQTKPRSKSLRPMRLSR